MSATFSRDKHDIGFLRTDGSTKVGLILARDRNGVPLYQTWDDEFLAEQKTETPSYDSLPPEKEIAIVRDDWRSGFGLRSYDATDPLRYHESFGMDLRHRGMAILGTKATAIAVGAVTWVSPTGFVDSDTSWSNEANAFDGNTGTKADEDSAVQNVWGDFLELTITETTISRVHHYNSGLGTYRADIDLYYDAQWNHLIEGAISTDVWMNVPVGSDIAVTAARIRFKNTAGADAQDLNEFAFGKVNDGNVVALADFNDELYIAAGASLLKLNSGGTAFDLIKRFDVHITDIEAFTDDRLYISLGASDDYWYMNTAESFTESDSKAYFMVAVGITMWKALLPRSIYSATNPILDANWSGATTVDSSTYNILELITNGTTLVIKKKDRTFYIDGDGNVQTLIGITRHLASDTSALRSATEWQGKYYLGYGKQSLIEYDGGTITWRSPAKHSTDATSFVDEVQAVTGDEEYLFAIIDNSAKVEVLAGRLETIGTTTKWVWHPLQEITLAGCETAYISSKVEKRLYIASTDSSDDSLYYMPLPVGYGDVVNDANRDFQTGGYFTTPYLHANFKGDNKSYIKATLEMGHSYDADIYYTLHYQKINDSATTLIGNFTGSSSSMIQTFYLPADSASVDPTTTSMQFRLTGVTDDVTKTPVLYSYDIRAILYPTKRSLIYCVVRGADDIKLNDDTHDKDSTAAYIKETLEEMRDATYPVTMYAYKTGTGTTVRVLPTKPFSRVVKDEVSGNVERYFYLLLQETPIS